MIMIPYQQIRIYHEYFQVLFSFNYLLNPYKNIPDLYVKKNRNIMNNLHKFIVFTFKKLIFPKKMKYEKKLDKNSGCLTNIKILKIEKCTDYDFMMALTIHCFKNAPDFDHK